MNRARTASPGHARVLFIHIPRTGGLTLARILARNYRPEFTFVFDSSDVASSIARYDRLHCDRRGQLRLITGHIPFGIHTIVGKGSYMAMLRDPVERVISIYEFIRRRRAHRLHSRVSRMTLAEFLESGLHDDASNGQCKWLSGPDGIAPRNVCGHDLLELAWQNIADESVAVGLTERFDESLILFRRRFGWARLAYARENSLPRRTKTDSMDHDILDTIRRHNALDIELYQRCQRTFDELVRTTPGLAREMRALQRSKALAAPWWRTRAKLIDLRRDCTTSRVRGADGGSDLCAHGDPRTQDEADLAGWRAHLQVTRVAPAGTRPIKPTI
jgi:hypothetical protein